MKDDSTAPLWGAWLQLRIVELWRAVALSIGREPTEPLREAIFKGRVTDTRAPPHVVELLKRWHYCELALANGRIKPQGYGRANPPVCPVLLAEVAAFLATAGFDVPEQMRALALVPAEPMLLTPAPAAAEPPIIGEDWKEKARDRARAILKRAAALDLYPSQADIADEIAADFRKHGTFGADGKPLSGASIKRHALSGISSAKKKAQSTTVKRGK